MIAMCNFPEFYCKRPKCKFFNQLCPYNCEIGNDGFYCEYTDRELLIEDPLYYKVLSQISELNGNCTIHDDIYRLVARELVRRGLLVRLNLHSGNNYYGVGYRISDYGKHILNQIGEKECGIYTTYPMGYITIFLRTSIKQTKQESEPDSLNL